MVAFRKDIVAEEVSLSAGRDGELVCAKITMAKAQPLYICAYYRPPKDTATALDSLELALQELQEKCENNPRTCIIVAGDFNAPGIDWESSTIKPNGRLKGMCERLLGILDLFHLKQLVTTPTRHQAILDLFCTNKPGLIRNIALVPGISDHDGVIIVDTHLKAVLNKKPRRPIPLWSKANWDDLKQQTEKFSTEFTASCNAKSVQENWDSFSNHIKSMQEKIPSKLSSTRYNLPWLTADIKRLCRKKRRVYNKAKAGSVKHQELFTQLRKQTQEAIRKAHWDYVNSIIEDDSESGGNKKFWRYLKAQRQDNQGVAPLREGNKLLSDALLKAKALNAQFSSVFTRDTPETADTRLEGPEYPPIPPLRSLQ